MEKRLTADLNVVANSNLEIQLLDGDLNIIQKLDDEPNDVGGLTSAELKAKFDESGNIIKKYINETLIPAVLTDDATEESRKQAEAAREAAEQGRVTAEEGRVSAETVRRNSENIRDSSEAERAQAERNRVISENNRVYNEGDRAQDEQKRVSAENSRVEAEAQRAAAEQARADETAGIVARATAQANAAESNALAAKSAQGLAESSEINALSSAQAAKSAASTASNAASFADQAATSASGSASQASAAATAAAGSATGAETASKTAQSWAVGGTGTRPGEDTDNAKYWAKQAESGSDLSLGITGTSAGQAPVVKTVDGGGKPTAWEAAVLAKADGSNVSSAAGDTWRTRIAALPGVKVYGKADANGKIKAYTDAACTEEVNNYLVAMAISDYGNALLIYDHKTYQCVGFEKPASGSGSSLVTVFSRTDVQKNAAGNTVFTAETARMNILDYLAGTVDAPITIETYTAAGLRDVDM